MKNLILASVLSLVSCSAYAQVLGTFTDSRDGRQYKTTKLGKQTWLGENLAYIPNDCPGYENCHFSVYPCLKNSFSNLKEIQEDEYYQGLGIMYSYEIANKVCPSGWRLPDMSDYQNLVSYLGGPEVAADKLIGYGFDPEDHFDGNTSLSGFSAKRFSMSCSATICATFWMIDNLRKGVNTISIGGRKPISYFDSTTFTAIRCIKQDE